MEDTPGSMEDNAEVFSYGGTLGFAWDVGKRATINLGYRFIGNEKATIDNSELKTTAHQIYITYGWRFLKK